MTEERPSLLAKLMKLLGLLVLATALLAMAFHAPDRPLESLISRWAEAPSDFVELPVEGGRIQLVHLRDEGPRDDPTPIVLLHGTAASLHTWAGWVSELKTNRRVITLDLPGFGLTGPSVLGDYSDEAYDHFLQAFLAHLKLGQVVLGGNSLGGGVAWGYAARHPEQVAALVLVDAGNLAITSEAVPEGFKVPQSRVLRALASTFLPRPLVERSVKSVYGDPSKVTAALVDRYFELTLREGNRAALAQRLAQRMPGRFADLLARIQAPTLILWGGQDRLIPPAAARIFQQQIRNSRLEIFPTLGHVPQEEDPLSTVRPVQAFLHSL
ncbi:Pimeloyl-ACP methyl ester carboxylesterase [Roseateles sp. YR242]|uniref:alpha/beta fold hydrolase n=1 Tax=Roseateles sp. YR242 TaxID=1855305 RepID=UPI0008BA5CD7|nr:alpha/beta fold hydrolase [Roseateles sp. YR242]SEL42994.1 Pimeloyl-ACP methyl ester carboxylesterase [Roseateles sp. YR242]